VKGLEVEWRVTAVATSAAYATCGSVTDASVLLWMLLLSNSVDCK